MTHTEHVTLIKNQIYNCNAKLQSQSISTFLDHLTDAGFFLRDSLKIIKITKYVTKGNHFFQLQK